MKAVILAGGRGSRIAEESQARPKPMIEIGGMPILWHIMKIYARHGVTDFIVCLGYKGFVIKEFFANYLLHRSDVTFDFRDGATTYGSSRVEPWRVSLIETGEATETGGRLRRLRQMLAGEESFCMTYGDGLADIDIAASIAFHRTHGRLATITAVQPPGRFGALEIADGAVRSFVEKPRGDGGWINGGFFVLSPRALDAIDDERTRWEEEPLRRLAARGELAAFVHRGFWQPMDTLRDKLQLETLYSEGRAPWKSWNE
ncbi:MAG: glucose-1-phosphate cytidylyltransferase [Alphaproteobacteria bacterium]|nr:glucose-1-phosphate cytidylyltransferase [Alphaproteobacteria bacterium]